MNKARIVRRAEGKAYDVSWVFKHGSKTGGPFDFMIGSLRYLTGPPLHYHREQHDTFYVLDGILMFQIDDELFDLMPGDFVSAPPGVVHTFDNVRKDQPPVTVINLMTPGGFDEFVVRLGEMGPAAKEPAKFAVAAEKSGIIIVGPTLGQRLGLTE